VIIGLEQLQQFNNINSLYVNNSCIKSAVWMNSVNKVAFLWVSCISLFPCLNLFSCDYIYVYNLCCHVA